MKHEKDSWHIYFYELKYLKESNLNKEKLPGTYIWPSNQQLHKVFAGITDFPKVIGESHELCKVFRSFYELHKSCLWVPRTS